MLTLPLLLPAYSELLVKFDNLSFHLMIADKIWIPQRGTIALLPIFSFFLPEL